MPKKQSKKRDRECGGSRERVAEGRGGEDGGLVVASTNSTDRQAVDGLQGGQSRR